METLEIILFNINEFILRSGDGKDKSLARAYITKISGTSFLNIQDLSGNEKEFVFCKFIMTGGKELILHFIADKLFDSEKPSTEKKLRNFIKMNLSNPELFNDEMKFLFIKVN